MLGVVHNPTFTDADRVVKEVADEMGCGDTWVPTPVGVFFGPDGTKTPGKTVPDPYFGGAGPARTGCLECGCCMTGCRYGAKNTLLKNYLGLAESAGAQVIPMTTVKGFEQRPDGLWEVQTVRTGSWLRRDRRTYTAKLPDPGRRHLGHAASAVQDARQGPAAPTLEAAGRVDPHQLRVHRRRRASSRSTPDLDLTHGVAITSSIHPTSDTHIEPVPLRQGLQRDGAAADADDRRARPRGHRRAALEAVARVQAATIRAACCGCSIPASGASAR